MPGILQGLSLYERDRAYRSVSVLKQWLQCKAFCLLLQMRGADKKVVVCDFSERKKHTHSSGKIGRRLS